MQNHDDQPKRKYYTDANKKAIKKYMSSDKGKEKVRAAKRRYYLKKRAEAERLQQGYLLQAVAEDDEEYN